MSSKDSTQTLEEIAEQINAAVPSQGEYSIAFYLTPTSLMPKGARGDYVAQGLPEAIVGAIDHYEEKFGLSIKAEAHVLEDIPPEGFDPGLTSGIRDRVARHAINTAHYFNLYGYPAEADLHCLIQNVGRRDGTKGVSLTTYPVISLSVRSTKGMEHSLIHEIAHQFGAGDELHLRLPQFSDAKPPEISTLWRPKAKRNIRKGIKAYRRQKEGNDV